MEPVRIRICQIFDFGTVVSMAGFDTESGAPIVVHVDHRPLQTIWNAWHGSGLPRPVLFAAERLTLKLDLSPARPDDPKGSEHSEA